MTSAQIIIMIAIVVYLAAVIIVGFRYSKTNNVGDFYLGGRKLGPLVTAMSAEASDMSSWLLMGLPGVAYATGLCDPFWTAAGLAIGTYFNWLIVAKRLRVYSQEIGEFTLPGFFSGRYHDKSNIIKLISALVIVAFFVPYTASGFKGCGKVFGTLFNADYHVTMIISAIVIVVYTMLGGFLAASVTDFIQSIVMSIAIITVLTYGISNAGGWDAVVDNAKSLAGYISLTSTHASDGSAAPYGVMTTISILSWGLGYFGMPHVLLRFMAIEDHKKLKLSRRIASIWVVIAMSAAILIGIVGSALTKTGWLPILDDPETIIVQISLLISKHGAFFALIAGIILAGILASAMSTADSQLLVASSSISEDVLKGFFKKNVSDKTGVLIARLTLLIIGIIAVIIAWDPDSSVFNIVGFAWAGFGAAFAPVMLFSLFWKRTTKQGVIAGMLTGSIIVFCWDNLFVKLAMQGGFTNDPVATDLSNFLSSIYELFPAFVLASIAIFVVSLITKEPDKEVTEEFDKCKKLIAES
ncbi:MAG: sodium/proline symporter [Saccharofermentans sp.]|nr:sodium/proline symporter [Saccharofermentans sp.]